MIATKELCMLILVQLTLAPTSSPIISQLSHLTRREYATLLRSAGLMNFVLISFLVNS